MSVPESRQVRLVLNRIEPRSVVKYSLVLYVSLYLVLVVAGITMWIVASVTGLRDNVEGFVGSLLAADDFHFLGRDILRASVTGGALLVGLGTGANLVLVALYNLISNLVGGVAVIFEQPPEEDDQTEASADETDAEPVVRRLTRQPGRRAGGATRRLRQGRGYSSVG